MKVISFFIFIYIVLLTNHKLFSSCNEIKFLFDKTEKVIKDKNKDKDYHKDVETIHPIIGIEKSVPDKQVYFQGWIKYLSYSDTDINKPKTFFINREFINQSKRNLSKEELNQKDKVLV